MLWYYDNTLPFELIKTALRTTHENGERCIKRKHITIDKKEHVSSKLFRFELQTNGSTKQQMTIPQWEIAQTVSERRWYGQGEGNRKHVPSTDARRWISVDFCDFDGKVSSADCT